ncbi:DegT/DnrJ/EryC1/StrS family aminotransferase [Starkeya koreensis]|uniref:DegT/DnrJ/EryC1/StrS family aminotransferase n=1 Tax=Ancylobacter koreensis TaxID=266121 RepID=A0ABT0DH98_9HYPH|nr:DegT/DnrJ/EryC1/StrS family aminotransferase [Ancylobacter koreensis]MCK0206462.1 DegT/DnrJ/EryC1/StrS family aminotransferase [Ancylobacter koreensis]
MRVPFLKPRPVRLSDHLDELAAHEASGVFSNFGPVNTAFETRLLHRAFGDEGACMTACNATIALLLALREATYFNRRRGAKFALVPSFTFAATAHAVSWCGLTPILYDVEPGTWLPSREAERRLLERHGDDVAALLPCATFGNCLDLEGYAELSARTGVPVVIDAAASLGSLDAQGRAFGRSAPMAVVYSMHATKTFATSEGAVIYCADKDRIARLRQMANFGFDDRRSSQMPGLNAKLAELPALLALKKLDEIDRIVERRTGLYALYRNLLPDFVFQELTGLRTAHQFVPALLPEGAPVCRADFVQRMKSLGVGLGTYFSPHLAEQPYFREISLVDQLAVTERLASRIVALPLYDEMEEAELRYVCEAAAGCLH